MRDLFCLIATLFLLPASDVSGQSIKAYERAGDEAFRNKNFGAALQYYSNVLKRRQEDLSLLWKHGESARMYQAFREAEQSYLRVAASPKGKEKFPLVDYRLAEVKKQTGDYEEAIRYFERFLAERPKKSDPVFFDKAQYEIESCFLAKALTSAPDGLEIKHLGKEINSAWNEFAPTPMGDTLFFASDRFERKGEKGKKKNSKLNKVMICAKGGRSREPGRGFPSTDTAHIAHTAFSPDGHYVFFTICQDVNVYDKRCELWLTVIDRRNRWLPPMRLPAPINLPGYTTTQPNIGYDAALEAPVLWFASDRPGGKGKLDLWYVPLDTNFFCSCNLPLPGKKFTYVPEFDTPVNAAELNTPENEVSPFFFAPTQKLFFSSDGLPGLGGYDIFSAEKSGNSFSAAQNAGAGLNSSYNDLYFTLKPDGKNGYLSSNRPGSLYLDDKKKVPCHDIFSFKLPVPEAPPLAHSPNNDPVSSSHTNTKTPAPTPPTIGQLPPAQPLRLEDFSGLPLYFDNDEPDKRTRRTTTKLNYEETVEKYLKRQGEYKNKFVGNTQGEKAEKAEQAVDDFFDFEVRHGAERLNQMCEVLLAHLEKGEQIEVLIKGFTSPRAESSYNLNLGKRRVSSVRNFFAAWSEGLLQPYLKKGSLSLQEVSFGETAARAHVSDELSDERNSIYNPEAARERRVEIVELRKRKE